MDRINYNNIFNIYTRLFEAYGSQKWWPTTVGDNSFPTYNNQPLCRKSRYEIAVGAVLTQNTNWNNAVLAIYNLSKLNLIDPELISRSKDDILQDSIKPSGFYTLKTKRLKNMTEWWLKNSEKILKSNINNEFTKWRNSLLKVNGIGPETADSILLYCFNAPTFVIDTYTKRIMNRHLGTPINIKYEILRDLLMNNLPNEVNLYKEYHALILKLAKVSCKKNQCLHNCPLRDFS